MTEYTFAAWDRSGAAASLADPDDLARTIPVRGQLRATGSVNGGSQQPVHMQFYGPGDVTALDQRQIVRVHPLPGTPDAETTEFPLVEFERSDLPWLFSPLAPGPTGLLRPWLALVCVPAAKRPHREAGRPLPVLRVSADELPDPSFLHLWAHAQMIAGHETDPRTSISRLLAPRRLLAHTDYVACVVPAFEAGRLAGLGDSGGDLTPAWSQAAETELPVYFSWAFSTGEGGDFETLADRLQARPLPRSAGRRPLDVSNPGLLGSGPGNVTQQVESALRNPEALPRDPWPVDAASDRWRHELASALRPVQADDGPEDPDVLPPLYGGFHALRTHVKADATGWLDTLNLDPRRRVAAGLGTRSVQREQEDLMASAWAQLADVRAANRFLDLSRLARLVGSCLHTRHVSPLSPDEFLHLAMPLRSRALFGSATLGTRIQDSALPTAMSSTAFRRATRPRGTLSRRVALVAAQGGDNLDRAPFSTALTTMAASGVGLAAAKFDPDGAVAFGVAPELVVAAERLPSVRAALGQVNAPSEFWPALTDKAVHRAVARDVTAVQLAAAPPIPADVLQSSFRLNSLSEIAVPASFLAGARLTPAGDLLLTSGRAVPAALAALTQGATADGSFTGSWSGPWDSLGETPAGSWHGDCRGAWRCGGAPGGRWSGVFTGNWADDPSGETGTWRAAFTGTWESDTDRGTWQGVCTGTYDTLEIFSDGTFTGTWRSDAKHGSWHGRCPGTWDWDSTGNGGIWRALCTGDLHLSVTDGATPAAEIWQHDHLGEVLSGWRPETGIPLEKVLDPDYVARQAGQLPADPVLGLTAEGMRKTIVSSQQRVYQVADAPPVPPQETFPAADAHRDLVALTHPSRAVSAVVESRIQRPESGGADDAPVLWAPTFGDPMWKPLAAQSTEWLLGGLEHVEPDTATLAVTNPDFVEAYLVGLNHEFARELRWREYPTDQRGTYFTAFWGAGADIEPIPRWKAELPVGEHQLAEPGRVVLVLRSALLRRYPGATVYAAPLNGTEPDDTRAQPPIFRGGLDSDTTFLGFALTKDELLATPWCFVIAEQPTEPRFGLDDLPNPAVFPGKYVPPSAATVPPTDADDWNNLHWGHLFDGPNEYHAATYAPGRVRPGVELNGLVWGADGAGIARQCFQQPVRVILPADRLLVPRTTRGEPG
ncbi:hypothetical protein ACFYXD_15740 [Streptomyces platensis]|uniref:hypothetical protein n=1 Tax=Streptomyces platensis TaxID=58346 RepID=UPI0036952570